MPELITSRSAAADVHGDAHVDRDREGGHAVDCAEVLDGAQSSVEPERVYGFVLRSEKHFD